jgi:hypothetical protein
MNTKKSRSSYRKSLDIRLEKEYNGKNINRGRNNGIRESN